MKTSSILSSIALACVAAAAPSSDYGSWGNGGKGGNDGKCVSQDQATKIVHDYAFFLAHADPNQLAQANATAQRILADDFTEQSDSINGFLGLKPGDLTFPNKQGYISEVLTQPPVIGITDLQLIPFNCNQVLWYWKFDNPGNFNAPQAPQPVQGMNIFDINDKGLIEHVNVEFSVFFYVDFGFNVSGFRGPITGVNP
ncbi:hypothetical protein AYO21_05627 [Fonsecaea monophora]|uniref:NTF2-like domain-containing protein n=2 Tax=Fonsecaea TaxID=40354 RepID=A0A0D2DS93_9EURO|nr:uncharacterized protein Z517_07357 [Fonsecaea pedrosoi CBS 271.37]XP_022512101.1 hypothetical protein AYO21_05627 [Fonsecaea monophora]KAH0839211.1 hypothetical protein FOPE_05598 [Fonsecaea pedrosoi]KIW80741.1 hypothetical protein Z517_07357 [Fonsecaea pedrosoi CBS 271.37]OAG40149.1 hypothetical protein AYO21_05627 [Fonsecaea monophora]